MLPETYEELRGDDRSAVLRRMMDARDRLLASIWAHRRADLPYKSPEEAVTLASIVEKETARPDERPRIAAVFLNRLKAGMPLQSDPTVIYGLTGGKPLGHGLRVSELASPTPYNTYKIAGLPPTPIGNPGRASLAAALDPPDDLDLRAIVEGERRIAAAVVEGQRDFGDVAGRSCRRPGEDHIIHFAAAQASGRGFTHHPTQRLDQVRFAATIRPDDSGEARLERQLRRVDKGFEPDQAKPADLHQLSCRPQK